MNKDFYLDKVRGGWFGKCLGGVAGMPFEGVPFSPEMSRDDLHINEVPNDDLELQLVWLCGLKKHGLALDAAAFGELWRKYIPHGCDEYCIALRNLRRGIEPPASGWKDNFFTDGMGAAIRSEIWAMLFPGRPDAAGYFAQLDAQVDHWGEGVYGEIFMSAAESIVFTDGNVENALRTALHKIPADTRLHRAAADIFRLYDADAPEADVREHIMLHYQRDSNFTSCVMNLVFIIYALLWGRGDFIKTILLAVNCGRDTDCTGASCGAFLGIAKGMAVIPDEWKYAVNEKLSLGEYVTKIPGTPLTFTELIRQTEKLHDELFPQLECTYPEYTPFVPSEPIPSLDAQKWLLLENAVPEEVEKIEAEIIRTGKCPAHLRQNVVAFDGLFMDLSAYAHDACHLTMISCLAVENRDIRPEEIQLSVTADVGSQLWIDANRYMNHHSRAKMIPSFHRAEGGHSFGFHTEYGKHHVFRLELFYCLPPVRACVMFGNLFNDHLDGFKFDI